MIWMWNMAKVKNFIYLVIKTTGALGITWTNRPYLFFTCVPSAGADLSFTSAHNHVRFTVGYKLPSGNQEYPTIILEVPFGMISRYVNNTTHIFWAWCVLGLKVVEKEHQLFSWAIYSNTILELAKDAKPNLVLVITDRNKMDATIPIQL